MKAKIFFFISIILIVSTSDLSAQLAKYQATYIFNFLNYTQWPKSYRSGNIVIGVVGANGPIVKELKAVTNGKKIGFRSISIKSFNNLSELTKCHVLFIPGRRSAQLPAAVKKLVGKSTLLVSSSSNGIVMGADINFVVKNNRLAFEMKPANAAKKSIVFSSSLKRLASKVY